MIVWDLIVALQKMPMDASVMVWDEEWGEPARISSVKIERVEQGKYGYEDDFDVVIIR